MIIWQCCLNSCDFILVNSFSVCFYDFSLSHVHTHISNLVCPACLLQGPMGPRGPAGPPGKNGEDVSSSVHLNTALSKDTLFQIYISNYLLLNIHNIMNLCISSMLSVSVIES